MKQLPRRQDYAGAGTEDARSDCGNRDNRDVMTAFLAAFARMPILSAVAGFQEYPEKRPAWQALAYRWVQAPGVYTDLG
jgi:hypothetical protein